MQTISEIRRDNLDRILAEAGTQAEIARRMNKSTKQVSQWFGKGSARDMSSALARELEVAFGKERGWMDNLSAAVQPLSQSVGLDRDTLASAIRLLQMVAEIRRTPSIPEINPVSIIVAYELVAEEARAVDDSNVLDFMRKFAERLEERERDLGIERNEVAGAGPPTGQGYGRRSGTNKA